MRTRRNPAGRVLPSGVLLVGDVPARPLVARFRQPAAPLGFLFGAVTMGQLLPLPMPLSGLRLIVRSCRFDSARRA